VQIFFCTRGSVAACAATKQAAHPTSQARRKPFEVDVTDGVEPGENSVAIRVDHRRITELFLGGIVRPILLIEKAKGLKQ